MSPEERRAAYACDIYVTNNEPVSMTFVILWLYKEELVLRGLNYVIIDEVDSVRLMRHVHLLLFRDRAESLQNFMRLVIFLHVS